MAGKVTNAVGQLLGLVCACDSGGFACLRGIALLREERVTKRKGDLTGFVFSIDGMVYGLRRHLDSGTMVRIHSNEGTEERLVDFGGGLRASDAREGQLQSMANRCLFWSWDCPLFDPIGSLPGDDRFGVVRAAPDGQHEAALYLDPETATIQLLLDTLDNVDARFCRVTYLNADHLAPTWSLVQLFRFDTRC